jgi:para-nitrobenzyl esterase
MATWQSAVAPTYQYEFDGGTAAHLPVHSAELSLIFGQLGDQASDSRIVALSARMQEYWTNFAKAGDPNGAGLVPWPRYESKRRSYMELSNDGETERAALRGAACAIYGDKMQRMIETWK